MQLLLETDVTVPKGLAKVLNGLAMISSWVALKIPPLTASYLSNYFKCSFYFDFWPVKNRNQHVQNYTRLK